MKKIKQFLIKNKGSIALGATILVASFDASAWTAPATGDTFYDAYDIVVNKFLKGPLGFVAGLGVIGLGIFQTVKANYAVAIPAVVAGGLLSGADGLTTSLGITLNLI